MIEKGTRVAKEIRNDMGIWLKHHDNLVTGIHGYGGTGL